MQASGTVIPLHRKASTRPAAGLTEIFQVASHGRREVRRLPGVRTRTEPGNARDVL